MQNEKMREEFESWRKEIFCGGEQRLKKCSNAPEIYYFTEVQSAWVAWQASRESRVVDIDAAAKALAESMDYPWEFMPEQGRARMRANAHMVIEAAGLKVKP